jgi:hypothetical protein
MKGWKIVLIESLEKNIAKDKKKLEKMKKTIEPQFQTEKETGKEKTNEVYILEELIDTIQDPEEDFSVFFSCVVLMIKKMMLQSIVKSCLNIVISMRWLNQQLIKPCGKTLIKF